MHLEQLSTAELSPQFSRGDIIRVQNKDDSFRNPWRKTFNVVRADSVGITCSAKPDLDGKNWIVWFQYDLWTVTRV